MRKLLLVSLLFAVAYTASAQKPCAVTKNELAPIRKLRLGMERAEFEKHYAGATLIVQKRHATDKTDFENLNGILFDFYDNRLSSVEFDYSGNGMKWERVQEFATNISDNLKLPHDAWRYEPGDFLATMACADFFVKINTKGPSLSLRDTAADNARKADALKAGEDKKKTFKP